MVQDIGASFGKTAWPTGNRNNIDDFETQRLVLGVENGRVQFDYHARHKELLENITPADVVWICRMFNRITDAQWADLFRGAAMPQEVGVRYSREDQIEDPGRPGASVAGSDPLNGSEC